MQPNNPMKILPLSQFLRRALFALVILAIPTSLSAQIKFYGTGTLPGGDYSSQMRDAIRTPDGILAVGTALVLLEDLGANGDTSVMWTPSLGMVPLANEFPPNLTTGGRLNIARVISANGEVFGGSSYNTPTPQGLTVSPAIWTNNGTTVTLLTDFGLSRSNTGITSLSFDGSVAYGFIGTTLLPGVVRAFRYTAAGGMMSIGFLHPDDNTNFTSPHSASSDGSVVVGNSYGGTSLLEAYRYTFTGMGPTGGTMTALPALQGGTWTFVFAMTPDASTTIGTTDSPDFPNGQLVRWHEGGPTEALGTPSPTDSTFNFNNIAGVTADGSVVAVFGSGATDVDNTSYVRNPSGWFDLQDILSNAGVDLTGWTLDEVLGISADGTLVFGCGIHNGNVEGFVAGFPVGFLRAYGDTTPPVLSLPGNIIAEATGPNGAIVNFSATATDALDGPIGVIYSQNPGTVFPLGVTVVTVSATDSAGNKASGSFTVTVRDTTPPVITSVTPSIMSIWPPNKKMVSVTLNAVANDAVGVASLKIISVTTNEPDNNVQWQITGPLTLNLLADRLGTGTGRIYTITVGARDAAGNASTRTCTVTVPHDQSK